MSAGAQFLLDPFAPAYTRLPPGELDRRAASALDRLAECRVCPRVCGAPRAGSGGAGPRRERTGTGHCGTGRHARVCSVFPHHGEEDGLRGTRGSGTLFFSLCNLCCAFCQNWDISQRPAGPEMTAAEIADEMLALQELGCHNINFVTPSHVAPQVLEAIAVAVRGGLRLPVVYNTSAYDRVETLRLFDGVVDIYMPDFKFWDPDTAELLCAARDYPERARDALREMHRQVGVLKFGPDGLARRGVLVRHLAMPGQGAQAAAIMQWLARELSPDAYVNLMEQYRPANRVATEPELAAVNRRPTRHEFESVREAARAAGLHRFDGRSAC